jgi:selenophosphate synthase
VESCTEFSPGVSDEFRALAFDPQTSGGLLVAIAAEYADAALAGLTQHKVSARRIGEVTSKSSTLLAVV